MKKLVVALILGALLCGLIADTVAAPPHPQQPWKERWQDILDERVDFPLHRIIVYISSALNMILLAALLYLYLSSYRKTKSHFTLGLSFFIGVLLTQRVLFLIFPLLPQLFETLALAILLVLSLE